MDLIEIRERMLPPIETKTNTVTQNSCFIPSCRASEIPFSHNAHIIAIQFADAAEGLDKCHNGARDEQGAARGEGRRWLLGSDDDRKASASSRQLQDLEVVMHNWRLLHALAAAAERGPWAAGTTASPRRRAASRESAQLWAATRRVPPAGRRRWWNARRSPTMAGSARPPRAGKLVRRFVSCESFRLMKRGPPRLCPSRALPSYDPPGRRPGHPGPRPAA